MENVEGMRSLLKRLNAVGEMADTEKLKDWQTRTTILAKEKHLPNKKTATTTRSIKPADISRDEARVEAGGAAIFLEYGTAPHVIRPRRGRFLRFPANVSGPTLSGGPVISTTLSGRVTARAAKKYGSYAYAFAREVNHPGTKPYPFMVPAGTEARDEIWTRDEVNKRWNKAG
jgi:hypothetical protein